MSALEMLYFCISISLMEEKHCQTAYVYIQIEDMVIQEFLATNITVLPPSRFSTGQDINSIPVCEHKSRSLQIIFCVLTNRLMILAYI